MTTEVLLTILEKPVLVVKEFPNHDKLKAFALKNFGWENTFHGEVNTAASIAILTHALLHGNQYTYLFTSCLLFDHPEILPNKQMLSPATLKEVNRCMYDVSEKYEDWFSSNS